MHLFVVETAVTNQVSFAEQHGYLVPVANAGGRIPIDVEHVHRDTGGFRHRGEFRQELLAQRAVRARVDREPQCAGCPDDLTECAMNSTVCAGTSPTAVTW